ncbi:MAG: MlaD family protein [Kiritimatiellaeota bacterium]|nr:MlaD family protein [Kiritimatiellota bacterium]
MNENKANYAKIGFFVLAGFGLILLAIGIAGAQILSRKEIYAETYISESITGLEIGSPVKYRGVPIGAVKRIGFVYGEYGDQMSIQDAPLNAQQILVIMALDPRQFLPMQAEDPSQFLEDLIASGLRVKVASQGITGLSYIEFDYFPTGPADPHKHLTWKPRHNYIPSAPSTFFTFKNTTEELMIKFNQLDLQGLADETAALLQTTRAKVSDVDAAALSAEAAQLLAELRRTAASVQALVNAPEIQQMPAELAAVIANVRRVAEQAGQQLEPLVQSFAGVAEHTTQLTDTLAAVATNAGARADQTFTALAQTAQTLNRITGAHQHSLAEFVQNLRAASESLSQLISELQANPAALIFGHPPAPLPETNERP